MGSFLNFILTLGLIIIVAAALMLFLMYRKARRFLRSFGADAGKARHGGRGRRRNGGTYGNTSGVIDARPPEQANRKIFKEGEGEYVDFTEDGGE